MADRPLLFDLYRLNLVDQPTLFTLESPPIRSDEDVFRVLDRAANNDLDQIVESGRSMYRWSVRQFMAYEVAGQVASVTLARSLISRVGQTVTESSIEDAISESSPPSAETAVILFHMERHLVIAEYNSAIMGTQMWKSVLQRILDLAANFLQYRSVLRLEPLPRDTEVLDAFRSFDILTRLRVRLRIPNPELDRWFADLHKQMENSRIREYTQDMTNPAGLSQEPTALPFAAAAMAQAGYKDGEITLTGYKNGRRATVKTGRRASRGRVDGLKEFIRGIAANAKAKETKQAIASILEEVERIAETPLLPPSGIDSEQ